MEFSESLAQCRALNISDEKRCEQKATSTNGLFCPFHSKQCQGLYRGYKNRNARLDRLDASPPPYLAKTKTPLVNQTFEDVDTKELCQKLHAHLFLKFQLLDRVIRARKLHHSRFFSMDMDYGHEQFISTLQVQKATVTRALERLERRTAEVVHKKEQWLNWVRECQNTEEENREKEQKKVKMEAALWKRHYKATQQRMRVFREKEDKFRQDKFLEAVYKERLAEREAAGEDSGEDWDPIEEVLEDSRGNFIDLIKHFLWLESPEDSNSDSKIAETDAMDISTEPASSNSAKKATPKKNGAEKPKAPKERVPDKSLIETKNEMIERLRSGTEYDYSKSGGFLVGSIQRPTVEKKTITYSENEITHLLRDVNEIKHLLFCRLLLGHATLLPAALRANNIEEFLANPDVSGSALRDVCLKMDSPGLQEIRDACADLFRTEGPEEEDTPMGDVEEEENADVESFRRMFKWPKQKGDLPDKWVSKREKAKAEKAAEKEAMGAPDVEALFGNVGSKAIDFGSTQQTTTQKKVRVKICGRTIWNYPSDKALSRGGWLQFCVIARESKLQDVVALCRNWDEFFELNILALWGYFPGQNWVEWVGGQPRQQMLQLGFITYYESMNPDAAELTQKFQTGSRQRNVQRAHAQFEARNIMCAHIKRDQVSRRLIQYLSMQTHELLILVRDAETGEILIKPPEDERWIHRTKSGLGRASKNEWKVVTSVGPRFFEQMDRHRDWHFDFKQYYDVYVWELEPGLPFPSLYNIVQGILYKAHRVKKGVDVYLPEQHILSTLCREEETMRVRDIRPDDVGVESIYDELMNKKTRFFYGEIEELMKESEDLEAKRAKAPDDENLLLPDNMHPAHLFYNEADAAEDAILFPEELEDKTLDPSRIAKITPLKVWEDQGFSMPGFVEGLDLVDSDWDSESQGEDHEESDNVEDEWEDDKEDDDDDIAMEGGDDPESTSFGDKIPDEAFLSVYPKWQRKVMTQVVKQRRDIRPRDHPMRMQDDFMRFMDKDKSRVFKEVWHKADLEPHAQERYLEMRTMAKKSLRFLNKVDMINTQQADPASSEKFIAMKLIVDMKVPAEDQRDVSKALAKILPFFSKHFLDSEKGTEFRDSLLFKQAERAKTAPNCRTAISNKYRPKDFFREYDVEKKKMEHMENMEVFPEEWDLKIRPIIASLYKAGVLRTRPDEYYSGQALSIGEPSRPNQRDMFIDFRCQTPNAQDVAHMEDPASVKHFRVHAAAFTKKHPNARFSFLRLWSSAYFYPLMIGPDNHDPTAFRDLIGRRYIWMFVPKDMACSEYSMHYNVKARILGGVGGWQGPNPVGGAYGRGSLSPAQSGWEKTFFKGSVVTKRDKYLVMGKDAEDCKRLTAATVFAAECRPWRQEVDLWKSFLGVDEQFLKGLKEEWYD